MGWKLHVFDHFFHAKTQGECLNRSVYFCTDLSAKMGVSIDVYCESNLILIFGTRFLKSAISMQFWIFATTLTRRPPDWWCDRQHQYGGQKIQVAAVAFRVHFMPSHRSPMPLSNFFSKRRRVVLDAGPLLEPPVPPLVRLRAPGFIPDLFWIYSHPSPFQEERQEYCEKCVRNGNRIYGGFMSDLFTFWALPGGAPEKKGCNKSDPPFGLGPNGGSDLWPPN